MGFIILVKTDRYFTTILTFLIYRSEKPNAFFSHGIGPRMCIGPRMARLEIKMALCKLLRKHTILLQNPKKKLSIHTDFTVQATTTLTAPIYASVLRR